jgi:hypothetical protein
MRVLPRRPLSVAAAVLLLSIVAVLASACDPSPAGAVLVSYERAWPDGFVESQTIWADGRIEMRHGDRLERFTITPQDVDRVRVALGKTIPTGTPDDSPRRTLTLPDGTVLNAPRPDPGTATELLERLLERHTTL